MIDLEKLTPAPWVASDHEGEANWDVSARIGGDCLRVVDGIGGEVEESNMENLAFIALSRNAFDVMMRMSWHVWPDSKLFGDELKLVWHACAPQVPKEFCGPFSDPFTALVEADAWYKEHVEKAGA